MKGSLYTHLLSDMGQIIFVLFTIVATYLPQNLTRISTSFQLFCRLYSNTVEPLYDEVTFDTKIPLLYPTLISAKKKKIAISFLCKRNASVMPDGPAKDFVSILMVVDGLFCWHMANELHWIKNQLVTIMNTRPCNQCEHMKLACWLAGCGQAKPSHWPEKACISGMCCFNLLLWHFCYQNWHFCCQITYFEPRANKSWPRCNQSQILHFQFCWSSRILTEIKQCQPNFRFTWLMMCQFHVRYTRCQVDW